MKNLPTEINDDPYKTIGSIEEGHLETISRLGKIVAQMEKQITDQKKIIEDLKEQLAYAYVEMGYLTDTLEYPPEN